MWKDAVHIDVAAAASGQTYQGPLGRYAVRVGLYAADGRRLTAASATGLGAQRDAEGVTLARDLELGCSTPGCANWQPVNARFADRLELLEASLTGATLELHWRALAANQEPCSVFVHLVDAAGRLATQADYALRAEALLWLPSDNWTDAVALDLATLPASEYRLGVGVYTPDDGLRLPAKGPSGALYADEWVALPFGVSVGHAPYKTARGAGQARCDARDRFAPPAPQYRRPSHGRFRRDGFMEPQGGELVDLLG